MQVKKLEIMLMISPIIIMLHSGFLETTSGLNQKGNKAFGEKRYDTALDSYRKAQVKNPDNPTVRYNVGTTLYQMDQFQEAESQLAQALTHAKTKELKALAYYNDGNTNYRLGQFDKAIESYRKALDLNPNDKDAKYNLELLQKKKSMFDTKQDKRDDNRQKQQPPSQPDKQEQQQQSSGKDKQDQQSQNQEGQEQNQGQQQNQDQKEEQPSQGREDEKEQEKEDESQQQEESQKQDQKDQQKPEEKQSQESQAREEEEGQENEQQPSQPEEQQAGQEQKPEEGQGEQPKPLLQGQMSKESAGRILDALKASEQELQSLRRPRQQAEHEPLKDW